MTNLSICKDNFFDNPYQIVEFTNQIKFKPTKYMSGKRSDYLHIINKPLHDYVNKKIIDIYYSNTIKNFSAYSYFQKSDPDKHDGWVHPDTETLTAIIYLTIGDTVGTSIYNLKEEFKIPDWNIGHHEKLKYFENKKTYTEEHKKIVYENKIKHNKHFNKTMHYDGRFNRMICFDSKQFHAAEVCTSERLILISFLNDIDK